MSEKQVSFGEKKADHFCEQARYYARQGLACPACEFIILLACVFALSELQTLQNLYIIFSLLLCTPFWKEVLRNISFRIT